MTRILLPSLSALLLYLTLFFALGNVILGQDLRLIGNEARSKLDDEEVVKDYESIPGVHYQQIIPSGLEAGAKPSQWRPGGIYSEQFIKECLAQAEPRASQLANGNVLNIYYVLSHLSSDQWYAGKAKQIMLVCVILRREYKGDECPTFPRCKSNPNEYRTDGYWLEHIFADQDYTRNVLQACNQKYGWRASSSMRTDNIQAGHIPREQIESDSKIIMVKRGQASRRSSGDFIDKDRGSSDGDRHIRGGG